MGGSDQDEVATININIVPMCFTCLDSMNSPAYFPIFRVDGLLIALNDGVYTLQYGLIVTNFDSLSPQLQEGGNYQISCFQQSLFRDVVTKIPFCQECALTLGDTNLWPTPGPILISPTRTFIQANLATTLSELYFLSNYSW